jgi:hypothetical protein
MWVAVFGQQIILRCLELKTTLTRLTLNFCNDVADVAANISALEPTRFGKALAVAGSRGKRRACEPMRLVATPQ